MTNKNGKQIVVELRAWVDRPDQIRNQIKKLGATLMHTKTFTDHYYGKTLGSLWEEAGEAVRIREFSPNNCEVIKKEGVVATAEGKFDHETARVFLLFKGNLEKSKKFLEQRNYPQHLLSVKKTRETYLIDSVEIHLDTFETFGAAMEVSLQVNKVEDVSEAKEKLSNLLKRLGVKNYDVSSSSITGKILLFQLLQKPEIKKEVLKEALKKYEAKLERSLAKRGDAYTHGGDGWHDNPAFEELEREYHHLVSRIHEIKKELFELSTSNR
jgi:predicted adenylyl cyclase CyaB